MADRTVAEMKFINEYTRTLLVNWCTRQLQGAYPIVPSEDRYGPYIQYARDKKWLSKKEDRVLGPGFSTAAGFLKR